MQTIKFGTDGWRAIIADNYTVENVRRVAYATAIWLKQKFNKPSIVLGYDCRFGGLMFCEKIIEVMAAQGVKVYFDKQFVSTPMISLAAHSIQTSAGVIITASHNPPLYNGFKLKSNFGGPTLPKEIAKVEALIPDHLINKLMPIKEAESNGLLEINNFRELYYQHVKKNFNLKAIFNTPYPIAYDAMYGAGQNIFPKIVPNVYTVRCEYNPSFKGQAPEPIAKNLVDFSRLINDNNSLAIGLATDGDADRIGLLDSKGNFIDAHHIILLLIHILHKYKKMQGKVVVAFSVSPRIITLCKNYGLDYEVTPIGFKYIAEIMTKEDVLVGGEESGGIAVKGHIPERDGIWDGLIIFEYMAESGKSIETLIQEVYDQVGTFSYNRNDLHVPEETKTNILKHCQNKDYKRFGKFTIEKVEDLDGYKYYLGNNRIVMIRPSGTEPVLRVYAEAETPELVKDILEETKKVLLS